MKKTYIVSIISLFLIAALFALAYIPIYGQAIEWVECGKIIPGEFTSNVETHTYLLDMESEESFTAFVKRSGTQLTSKIDILGPKGESIVSSHAVPEDVPTINTGPLSASGTYKIEISNWRLGGGPGKTGKYQLHIGCDTLTGPIRPGEISPASTVSEELPIMAPKAFLEVGASYDVHLASGVYAAKIVEIREDGWIEVIIDNRVGWLNSSQVALIMPLD